MNSDISDVVVQRMLHHVAMAEAGRWRSDVDRELAYAFTDALSRARTVATPLLLGGGPPREQFLVALQVAADELLALGRAVEDTSP